MSDGDDFVGLRLESLFNLREGGTTTNWSFELSRIRTVDLKAFGERICEISMPSEVHSIMNADLRTYPV